MLSIDFGMIKRENESWILGDEEEVQERMSQSEMCCRNKEVDGKFLFKQAVFNRRRKKEVKIICSRGIHWHGTAYQENPNPAVSPRLSSWHSHSFRLHSPEGTRIEPMNL